MTITFLYPNDKRVPLSTLKANMAFEYNGSHYIRLQQPTVGISTLDKTDVPCVNIAAAALDFLYHSTLVTPTDCTITITDK